MSTDPSARPARISLRSEPVTRLVSSSTRNGRSPKRFPGSGTLRSPRIARTPVACCSASTSVGAISAPWCPPCTACSNVDTATTVLPDPTSPCSNRCIGCGPARSPSISAITRRWAPVSGYGSASWKRRTSSPSTTWRQTARCPLELALAQHEHELHPQQLVERQPPPGACPCRASTPAGGSSPARHHGRASASRPRIDSGTGSAMPRSWQRRSASSTQPASSHVLSCAFSLCG